MPRSLYGRLALSLVALLGLIGALFLALSFQITRAHYREVDQKLHRSLAASLVKENLPVNEAGVDHEALKHVFHTAMVINPRIECYLLGTGGEVLAFSAPEEVVKMKRVSLEPVRRFLDGAPSPLFGDDPRHPGASKVFSVAPVTLDGEPRGYLYIVLGGDEYDSVAGMLEGSYVLRLGLGLAGAILLFGASTGLLGFHLLTRRLRRLAAAVEEFQAGDFRRPVSLPETAGSGDELDRLGHSFDRMARRIIEQLENLEETDSLRRELVANVSHDLRTPLASLQGYLETLLLKDDTLSREEKLEYLEIARRHGERLGKLIGDLFELAKLESRDMELRPEPFPLAELVQDVVQKFQLQAKERKITLRSDLPTNLPFVHADLPLVERVLDNLLDNALRHTTEGGEVVVGLAPAGGRAGVTVADTGCGIPEEALPHIFDRYFRIDRSDPERKGSGLGLAIAHRVVELHGGRLNVRSAVGAGSTFTFDLPLTAP